MGAVILFWGWRAGFLALAVVMLAIVEGSRLIRSRWELSQTYYHRFADMGTLVTVFVAIYYFTTDISQSLQKIISWLPIAMFPLFLAQIYGTRKTIDISAFFLTMRKKKKKRLSITEKQINFSYPYFAVCLLAAGIVNLRSYWFYFAVFILVAWALWAIRPRRHSIAVWVIVLLISGGAGFGFHQGLNQLQKYLMELGNEWYLDNMRRDVDPYRTRTAIGDIGTLKPSSRVLFRVKLPQEQKTVLLREACYSLFYRSTWTSSKKEFQIIKPEPDNKSFFLSKHSSPDLSLTVSSYLRNGQGLLKLPAGSVFLDNLPVSLLEQNAFGVVKASFGPGLITYEVAYDPMLSLSIPPGKADVYIPGEELPAIQDVLDELDLNALDGKHKLIALEQFFEKNFTYSLNLSPAAGRTALSDFLLQTRSGHCEYFATAAVLILRAAGIPARYQTGYALDRNDQLNGWILVRDRHAHAWAQAYVDRKWQTVDPTPSDWSQLEYENASSFEVLYDLWSEIVFQFSKLRWGKSFNKWLIGGAVGLLLIMVARRFYGKRNVKRVKIVKSDKMQGRENVPGIFADVETELNQLGFCRHSWETIGDWLERIQRTNDFKIKKAVVADTLKLYYRYRFDPDGIEGAEEVLLRKKVNELLNGLYV